MTGYDASTNALRRKIDAESGNPLYAYRREAERLREENATLRAQLAVVRERVELVPLHFNSLTYRNAVLAALEEKRNG